MSETEKQNGNGEAPAAKPPEAHLTITVTDPATFALLLAGEVPSIDYALNMLAQATREYEAQWRLQRMAQEQQRLIAAAETEQVRRDLQRRH